MLGPIVLIIIVVARYTIRPLFKKITQHCETYEPTNCCVKKYTTCVKLYTICVKLYTSCVIFLHNFW